MAKSVSNSRSGIEFLGADDGCSEPPPTNGIVVDLACALKRRQRPSRVGPDVDGVRDLMPAARDVLRRLEQRGWEFRKRSSR